MKFVESVGKVIITLSRPQYFKKAGFGLRWLAHGDQIQRSKRWVVLHQKKVEKT